MHQRSRSTQSSPPCERSTTPAVPHAPALPPGDFEGSWLRATSADSLSRSPNFYVHCPARTDPTAAPPGADSVMVLLPVANIQQVGGACGLRCVCLKGPTASWCCCPWPTYCRWGRVWVTDHKRVMDKGRGQHHDVATFAGPCTAGVRCVV